MQITAPFGYGDIVPLEKTHKVLLPSIGPVTGSALFDKAGKPAPQWVEREDLLPSTKPTSASLRRCARSSPSSNSSHHSPCR